MKLQRQEVGSHVKQSGEISHYYKHSILVPNNVVSRLAWNEGEALDCLEAAGVLVIFPVQAGRSLQMASERAKRKTEQAKTD